MFFFHIMAIVVDFVRLNADGVSLREKLREWQTDHLTDKCNDFKVFRSEYLDHLIYSQIPELLDCQSAIDAGGEEKENVEKIVGYSRGHVLAQLLDNLVNKLNFVAKFAAANVLEELQGIVSRFWECGKRWELGNTSNRVGNPTEWFGKISCVIRGAEPAESLFKVYVKKE